MVVRKGDAGSMRAGGLSAAEVEDLVGKMGKEGITSSKIGLVLRDQHAVPSVKGITGKSVKAIMEAHDIKSDLPEDMINLIRDAVRIGNHIKRNRKDFGTKRSLERIEARIIKLAAYYKGEGDLPADWRYDRERAALLVRA